MPLEELLALYGYNETEQQAESEQMDERESEPDPPDQESKLSDLYENMPENDQDASRLLRCKLPSQSLCDLTLSLAAVSRVSEEEEEDYDYSPDEDDWRKVNKVIVFRFS